jgi:hypothetical protein
MVPYCRGFWSLPREEGAAFVIPAGTPYPIDACVDACAVDSARTMGPYRSASLAVLYREWALADVQLYV